MRRCCAFALDVLAAKYGEDLLTTLLPTLQTCFSLGGDGEDAWMARECGILALGTVADGAGEYMLEHFSSIMPFLLAELADTRVSSPMLALWI